MPMGMGQHVRRSPSQSLETPPDSRSNLMTTPSLPGHDVFAMNSGRNSQSQERSGSGVASTAQSNTVRQRSPTPETRRQHRPWMPVIRTLPGWIRSVETDDENVDATTHLLPPVEDAVVAQHNHSPFSKQKDDPDCGETSDGRLDNATQLRESRWRKFAHSVAYPPEADLSEHKTVTWEWLNENHGDYSQPYNHSKEGSDLETGLRWRARRKTWIVRLQANLLKNPIVPLVFRLIVWIFSLIALALGASINHLSRTSHLPQGPSADMAIIIDAVALVYLLYITYDEYSGKPLGLRSAKAKMRLIFLDIFFIVFDSANLSLAFASLSDVQGSCTQSEVNNHLDPKNDPICDRQKVLASVLLIALIGWLSTFAISVFRLVERVASK